MNKAGPIVIIEDDQDDQDILKQIFDELKVPNKVIFFTNPSKAFIYLNLADTKPFIIISDIKMPLMDGFELRAMIRADANLEKKCIPYLFFTTDASKNVVAEAYIQSVQGIFQKPPKYDEWKDVIDYILKYWNYCMSPNRID